MAILKELRDRKILCQFNQGLDIRLLNDENAKILSEMKYYQKYIFAFDSIHYLKAVERGTIIFKKYVPGKWRMRFLVYYNGNDPLKDLVFRIKWAKQHHVLPYIMRDKNCKESLYKDFLSDYTGWVGSINGQFCSSTFAQYLYKNRKDRERIYNSLKTYQQACKGLI